MSVRFLTITLLTLMKQVRTQFILLFTHCLGSSGGIWLYKGRGITFCPALRAEANSLQGQLIVKLPLQL